MREREREAYDSNSSSCKSLGRSVCKIDHGRFRSRIILWSRSRSDTSDYTIKGDGQSKERESEEREKEGIYRMR